MTKKETKRRARFRRPPFGVQTARFTPVGINPKADTRPGTFPFPKIAPGIYFRAEKPRKCFEAHGWEGQQKLEEYSRTMNGFGGGKAEEKRWLRAINGPGWQDVEVTAFRPYGTMSRGARFPKEKKKGATPGPGIYGKEHVPSRRIEEAAKRGFCTVPPFEWNPIKAEVKTIPYHLPPNRYPIKGGIQLLTERVVSLKGPYELFSGPRDNSNFFGYIAPVPPAGADRMYHIPNSIEILNHHKNSFKGKFFKTGRETKAPQRHIVMDPVLCAKDPEEPAPNFYYPSVELSCKRSGPSVWPFNTSLLHARQIQKVGLHPGPGRYHPAMKRHIFGNGWRSNFLSKTKREPPMPERLSWFF